MQQPTELSIIAVVRNCNSHIDTMGDDIMKVQNMELNVPLVTIIIVHEISRKRNLLIPIILP